jgi:hypothetical protein
LGPGFDFRLTLYHHAERLDRQTPKIRKYLVIRIKAQIPRHADGGLDRIIRDDAGDDERTDFRCAQHRL